MTTLKQQIDATLRERVQERREYKDWRARIVEHYIKEKLEVNCLSGRVYSKKNGRELKAVNRDGYAQIGIRANGLQATIGRGRVVYWTYHGRWPWPELDHIDGNKLNDRIDNLQELSCSENVAKQKRFASRTLPTGVFSRPSGRYVAQYNKKYIGTFDTPEEANEAYLKARDTKRT